MLSPAIGLFVTVPAQREALSRVHASVEALRPHGFVVRCQHARQSRQPRPSHPAPNVRDDREAPLLIRCGTTSPLLLFLPTCEAKYFSPEDWTGKQISGDKSRQGDRRLVQAWKRQGFAGGVGSHLTGCGLHLLGLLPRVQSTFRVRLQYAVPKKTALRSTNSPTTASADQAPRMSSLEGGGEERPLLGAGRILRRAQAKAVQAVIARSKATKQSGFRS